MMMSSDGISNEHHPALSALLPLLSDPNLQCDNFYVSPALTPQISQALKEIDTLPRRCDNRMCNNRLNLRLQRLKQLAASRV